MLVNKATTIAENTFHHENIINMTLILKDNNEPNKFINT